MSDTNNSGDKPITVERKKTLTLRRGGIEQGTVRQSFSHGRSKAVVVEKKKRRIVLPTGAPAEAKVEPPKPAAPPAKPAPAPAAVEARAPAPAEPQRPEAREALEGPQTRPSAPDPAPPPSVEERAVEAVESKVAAADKDADVDARRPSVPGDGIAMSGPPDGAAGAAPVAATDRDDRDEGGTPAAAAAEPVAEDRPDAAVAAEAAAPAPASAAASAPAPQMRGRDEPPAGKAADVASPAARGRTAGEQRPAERAPTPSRGGGSGRGAAPRGDGARTAARERPGGPGGRSGARPDSGRPQIGRGRGQVHRTLTSAELDARSRALSDAKARESEDRQRAQQEVEKERSELERIRRERTEAEARAVEEVKRAAAEEETRKQEAADASAAGAAEGETGGRAATRAKAKPGEDAAGRRKTAKELEEEEAERTRAAKKGGARAAPAKPAPRGDDRRRTKLTITTAFEEDSDRGRSLAAMRRRREKEKRAAASGPREKVMREVIIPETITIQELASRMAERGVDVIKILMGQGQMHKITDVIDADTAELVATELGHSVKRVAESDVEEGLFGRPDDPGAMVPRPPVVTIMGHVDHGKTSLLDALRHANVASGEAGGITQHIGAYQVELNNQKITFLDTPGHAAFTAMRARGAKATDIVILVVAADDGVMPQTIEAINHARAAKVPMIVAINKIDKPGADPNRVRTDLLQHEVVVESMGGDVQDVEVSALKQMNLDGLLEACLLLAEFLELKADPEREAEGVVVEAKLDRGRGPVATVLVQRGTLNVGDILIAGSEWGRVRALLDDQGQQVKAAGPSMPVEVLGLQATPEAGDQIAVVENEARAREISEYRQRLKREKNAGGPSQAVSLEQMMSDLKTSGRREFPLVLKGDVQGSVEAIDGALDKLNTEEVAARILHSGVGGITESDVTLASATGAVIMGFNVRANKQAREAAERAGVEIRYYSVIYNLIDDVKQAMSGMLAPERRENFLGYAEILQVFSITKVGKVAGCRVTEGTVERGASVRLLRDNVVIHEGTLRTLKRFKDEVKEVHVGQECGMAFERYEDIREGDVIECFRVEEVARALA